MLDIMFELPDQEEGTAYTIDADPQVSGGLSHRKVAPKRKESA